jgi:hypothetical protein
MLHVQDDEIEAGGADDLHHMRNRKSTERADNRLASGKPATQSANVARHHMARPRHALRRRLTIPDVVNVTLSAPMKGRRENGDTYQVTELSHQIFIRSMCHVDILHTVNV